MQSFLTDLLNQYNCNLEIKLNQFDGAHLVDSMSLSIQPENVQKYQYEFKGNTWETSVTYQVKTNRAIDIMVAFKLLSGYAAEHSVAMSFHFDRWAKNNYVLMPAAVYNGNRFDYRRMSYPPMFKDKEDMRIDAPTVITDVPKLNIHEGESKIQQITRDLSTPAIGFYAPGESRGFWLLTEQGTCVGDSGIHMEESLDRQKAVITIEAPGVRREYKYRICDNQVPSDDRGADFKEGDEVHLHFRAYFFECPNVQALFDYFVNIRKDLTGPVSLHHEIPFYSAWKIQEEKYNQQNWEDEHGYYSVGMRENIHQNWQIGWVGGLINTYPLLFEGTALSQERALKTFDFVFPKGQAPSGFFYGCGDGEHWYGDNFYDINDKNWLLIRKNSDALYYIIKHFMLLEARNQGQKIAESWKQGTIKCADAFVNLWNKYHQFGQFVNAETGEIIVGGSTSAGSAPAGLALAGQFFGREEYIAVAKEAANYYYDNYVRKGITTGGPGEILQCPDSESAFGLLESFVVLFEVTGETTWLEKARDMANQCFTWCVSYDFKFPPQSTFGKLGMHTTGSVYANVQNKHSAPGICTFSGDSLFKLFRATGDRRYLELLQEMAHNMPQYLSREDRSVGGMPAGWMNERVQMSDWFEPIGEIFFGSCWCEISNMLSYVEVPGLYVQPDTGFICAIDHVDVEIIEKSYRKIGLKVTNPTKFKAKVKVFVENSDRMKRVLGQHALLHCERLTIEPGSSVIVKYGMEL